MYKYYIPSLGLDVEAMHKAVQLFVGDHDFRNFCKIDLQRIEQPFVRTIYEASVYPLSNDPKRHHAFKNDAFHVFCVKVILK